MKKNTNQFTITLLLLFICDSAYSNDPTFTIKADNLFIDAEVIKRHQPSYPINELNRLNAGMVDVTFMVNKNGNTYEPVITTSSSRSFEKQALHAISKFKYKPASFNGNSVDSVQRTRMFFLVEDQKDQVSRDFNRHYRSATKELKKDNPNKEKIQKSIKLMEKSTHLGPYSYRYLNTVKQAYAKEFNSKRAQIDSIYQLLLFEISTTDLTSALNKEQRISVRRLLVALLIETSEYGSASIEYKKLKIIDPEATNLFQDTFKQIDDILNSGKRIEINLALNASGYNSTILFKQKFGFIETPDSNISQLKLRCERKFKILDYIVNSEYQIPKSWGQCHLQTIGSPDSKATLYQL